MKTNVFRYYLFPNSTALKLPKQNYEYEAKQKQEFLLYIFYAKKKKKKKKRTVSLV